MYLTVVTSPAHSCSANVLLLGTKLVSEPSKVFISDPHSWQPEGSVPCFIT